MPGETIFPTFPTELRAATAALPGGDACFGLPWTLWLVAFVNAFVDGVDGVDGVDAFAGEAGGFELAAAATALSFEGGSSDLFTK